MTIRKLHKSLGLMFSPFFLITAVTGLALLLRKSDLYGDDAKRLMLGLHNWEIVAKYVGAILALALIAMTLTGLSMALRLRRRR